MTKIISIANQKGGVGKTTTTVNLGVSLARLNYRVLIIDIDAQGHSTISLGIKKESIYDKSIVEVLEKDNELTMKDVIYSIEKEPNLFIVPSMKYLAQVEIEMNSRIAKDKILNRSIKPIKDEYDYILIDCPPQLSLLTVNAFSCSDYILIPVKTDELSLDGLDELLETYAEVKDLLNDKLEILGTIANFYESNTKNGKRVLEKLKNNYELELLTTFRRATDVEAYIAEGQTITQKLPNHDVSLKFKELANIIVERTK